MGNGGDVGDAADLVTTRIQSTHGRLTTRAGAFDAHVQVLQAILESSLTGTLGRYLGSERGAFARTTEAGTTGGSPAQGVALTVGNGDDGVVERRVDVGNPINDCLFLLFYVHEQLA